MSSTVKKQAPRPARPVGRYWKGKAPQGVVGVDSDSEEENEQPPGDEQEDVVPIGGEQDILIQDVEEQPTRAVKTMNIALKDVDISKDGRVMVAGRVESGRTQMEESEEETSSESEEEEAKGEESEEESSEEESSEEEQPKVQFRPVFVPKRGRVTIAERDVLAPDSEDVIKKREAEAEERRKQSHDLVAESIRRELAEKEKEKEVPDVDDTDGLDPTAEFEAWRLRELSRIKKEKEDEMQREQEREEVERRRALPEAQRLQEDLEHAQKSREEKPKGKQKFLQKYWHKGAFHQDEEILKRHDYTEATESTVDISMLPKVMQVRDFGKRSRTKYTHLVDQDTTVGTGGFGGSAPVRMGGTSMEGDGCFLCGGPHLKKDCPQNTGPLTQRGPPKGREPLSSDDRQWKDKGDSSTHRRERDEASWGRRKGSRDHGYQRRSHSRSRSPYRRKAYRDGESRWSRQDEDSRRRERRGSRSRSIDSDHRGKRRRVD